MDTLDFKAISILMDNGRATWSDVAGELGMSGPAAAERIHRLEEQGVIKGYSANVDPEAVGCGLTAFVSLSLDRPEHKEQFLKRVAEVQEIQDCHYVTGEDDYLLKVRCRSTRDLDRVISVDLKGLPGVAKTRTTIVLETCKETPVIPLYPEASIKK